MKPSIALAAGSAVLSGCAAIVTADCGADPYEVGRRDGRIDAYAQAERYKARCGPQFDTTRYVAGWRDGLADRPTPPR